MKMVRASVLAEGLYSKSPSSPTKCAYMTNTLLAIQVLPPFWTLKLFATGSRSGMKSLLIGRLHPGWLLQRHRNIIYENNENPFGVMGHQLYLSNWRMRWLLALCRRSWFRTLSLVWVQLTFVQTKTLWCHFKDFAI